MHASALVPFLGRVAHSASGLIEWLATYAIHSTILIGGLLLLTATSSGRRLTAGYSTTIWRFALVGGLLTASMQSLRDAAPVAGTLRLSGDTPTRTMVRVELDHVRAMKAASLGDKREQQNVQRSSITIAPGWPIVVLAIWLAAAVALLARFFAVRARFLQHIGPRARADHTLAGHSLHYLTRASDIHQPVRLTRSDCLTSPIALGRDEICLPSRALAELDPIRMESILAHELAHLVRGDTTWLTIARVIEAVFFFQPLNVLARRRMQEAAEFASDAWASSRVARPLDLAHCLARVAEWTIAAPRMPVPAMAESAESGKRSATLVHRVQRLTTGRVVAERAPGRAMRLAGAVAVAGLVMLAPRAAVGAADAPNAFIGGRLPRSTEFIVFRELDSTRTDGAQRKTARTLVLTVSADRP